MKPAADLVVALGAFVALFILSAAGFGLWLGLALRFVWILAR